MRAPFTWLSFSIVVVAGSFLCHSQACSSDSFNDDTNQLPVKNVVVSNSYLCRMCGSSLEDAGSFLQVASPFCLGEKNETVVAKKGSGVAVATITLQRLTNPAGIEFEVLAVKKSSCTGVGKVNHLQSPFFFICLTGTIFSTVGVCCQLVSWIQLEGLCVQSVWSSFRVVCHHFCLVFPLSSTF